MGRAGSGAQRRSLSLNRRCAPRGSDGQEKTVGNEAAGRREGAAGRLGPPPCATINLSLPPLSPHSFFGEQYRGEQFAYEQPAAASDEEGEGESLEELEALAAAGHLDEEELREVRLRQKAGMAAPQVGEGWVVLLCVYRGVGTRTRGGAAGAAAIGGRGRAAGGATYLYLLAACRLMGCCLLRRAPGLGGAAGAAAAAMGGRGRAAGGAAFLNPWASEWGAVVRFVGPLAEEGLQEPPLRRRGWPRHRQGWKLRWSVSWAPTHPSLQQQSSNAAGAAFAAATANYMRNRRAAAAARSRCYYTPVIAFSLGRRR